jgi:type IV pilus assembly protein PilC
MGSFVYTARDLAGGRKRGLRRSGSQREVRNWLRERGLIPLEVVSPLAILGVNGRGFALRRPKAADKASFCWQLATMIEGGVPITEAIDTIAEDIENAYFKHTLREVSEEIKKGTSLSDSIAQFPGIFTRLFCGMVMVGETSGSLPLVLGRLAEYLDQQDRFARKVKTAMTYPAFVLSFVAFVLVFMMVVIIPKFRRIFGQFGGKLPKFTASFLGVYDWVGGNIGYIILGLIGLVVLGIVYNRTRTGHARFSRVVLSLPLFGKVISQAFVATFCKTMATLLAAGVSIIEAFDIMAETTGNDVIRSALWRSKECIVQGSSVSLALAASGFFPNMVSKMVQVGEKSGSLPKVLGSASVHYERRVDAIITAGLNLLGPLLIVAVGGIVLVVVLALYLPIFTMSEAMSGAM